MRPIGYISSDFPTKFGIPRQSGLVDALKSTLILDPEFANPDVFRGLEGFSHIWLIWQFSQSVGKPWTPTVRPPRLGGNARMGVFATRSPFRPNPIGLSCVKLDRIEGATLHLLGADLMDGTPIFDIKPYIPYADCHPDALGGFAASPASPKLTVCIPDGLKNKVAPHHQEALEAVLSHDPRPSYQQDATRMYGLDFADYNVKFQVDDQVLQVISIEKL